MLLLVQTYTAAKETLIRHWPYFLKSGADEIWIVTTTDDNDLSWYPKDVTIVKIGNNSYINGGHLPQRLIDTLKTGLGNKTKFQHICICEYDTVFFHPLPIQRMEHAVAGYYAGGQTWNSKASAFYHNPWVFFREAAIKFVEKGQEAINEGVCGYQTNSAFATPEGSPDVFVGYACEHYDIPIQGNVWTEYSRNDLKGNGYLEEARQAYLGGYDVIHGIKTKEELEYITR
jgi:hypothetical protein